MGRITDELPITLWTAGRMALLYRPIQTKTIVAPGHGGNRRIRTFWS